MPLVADAAGRTRTPNDAAKDTQRDTYETEHDRVDRIFYTALGELLERDVRGLIALWKAR